MALITASEVIAAVSTRNIDAGHILPAEILIAENDYIRAALGSDLYNAIVADGPSYATYGTFRTGYIIPVLSYGILSNIWQRIGVEVTDRGINRFTGEGITTAPDVDKSATLFEIRQRLSSAIGSMLEYADEQFPALYEDQEYKYKEVNYYSAHAKRNNAL